MKTKFFANGVGRGFRDRALFLILLILLLIGALVIGIFAYQQRVGYQAMITGIVLATLAIGLLALLILYFSFGRIFSRVVDLNMSLEEKNRELEEARERLEIRVEERTASLTHTNARLTEKIRELNVAHKVVRQGIEEWQRTFDSIENVITILDPEMVVVRANDAACRLLGISKEDVIGIHCHELFHNSPKPCEACPVKLVCRDHHSRDAVVEHTRFGRIFSVTLAPILDQDVIIGYVHIAQDVSRQKKLEKQLIHAQKMESISTLAGGIAHDFNNILGAILGNVDLMLYRMAGKSFSSPAPPGGPPPITYEEIQENLGMVKKAGMRAKGLVAQLLAFSRQADMKRMRIDVTPVVKEAVKLLHSSLPGNIEFKARVDQGLGEINANPTEVHQMLTNLCANAITAMNAGGTLEVRLDKIQVGDGDQGAFPRLEPGGYVRLAISDTGHGMSPEIRERIFDPFFTTRELGEATGLGLAVIHGIMTDYGGVIDVRTAEGEGSTFTLFFPLAPAEAASTGGADSLLSIPGGKERILFVDDEEDIVQMRVKMLQYLGYEVVGATSGRMALDHFLRDETGFQLLITDLVMPEMTGLRLIEEVRSRNQSMAVVLASDRGDMMTEPELAVARIDRILRKPIEINTLAKVIRELLDNVSNR